MCVNGWIKLGMLVCNLCLLSAPAGCTCICINASFSLSGAAINPQRRREQGKVDLSAESAGKGWRTCSRKKVGNTRLAEPTSPITQSSFLFFITSYEGNSTSLRFQMFLFSCEGPFSGQIWCTFGGLKTLLSAFYLHRGPLNGLNSFMLTGHNRVQHFKYHCLCDGWFCCHRCLSAGTVGICSIICYTLAGHKWKRKDRQPCRGNKGISCQTFSKGRPTERKDD